MADLPGLIPGASQGVGLGFRFLKHLSRARLLLHLVDMAPLDGSDPVANAHAIEAELFAYSAVLSGTRDLDGGDQNGPARKRLRGLRHWKQPSARGGVSRCPPSLGLASRN